LVGLRCRDKETRGRAIDLIHLDREYHEGTWDMDRAGCTVSWIREIEDEKRDKHGEISEENRVFVTKVHVGPNRRGIIGLSQRSAAGLVYREKAVSW
jgi:hypothetical protein